MSKRGLVAAGILSGLAFGGSLFAAIWILTECPRGIFVVVMNANDDDFFYSMNCNYYGRNMKAWAVVAFVDSALFFTTAMCTMHFVGSRYDAILAKKLAQQQQEDDEVVVADINVRAVEMTETSSSHSMAPKATAEVLPPDTKEVDQV